ncbi:MAG: hypothetical protein PVH79_01320 [Candidatus Bathyarchaeota archaeon]
MRWSKVIGLASLVLLLIPSFGIVLAADVIDVWTGESYEPEELVELEGYTNVTGTVSVVITNSSGYEIQILAIDPDEDGEFSGSFTLDEDASGGIYEVNATVGGIFNTTSFEVVVESGEGFEEDGTHVESAGEDPPEEMTVDGLRCAIERALWFIERTNASTEALQDEYGYDMTLFWEKVDWLNDSLTELYESVDEINLEDKIGEFRELRKEISQLNGLLNSITKNVKMEKAKWFTRHMMRLIEGLKENTPSLSASAESVDLASALDAHQRKLWRLWLTLNTTIPQAELEGILDELEGVTVSVDSDLTGLGDDGYSLKEMYKLQARIQVFNATVIRMEKRGMEMHRLREKLGNTEQLMNQMKLQFSVLNQEDFEAMIGDANMNLRGVGETIREMNKPNQAENGKSKGDDEG